MPPLLHSPVPLEPLHFQSSSGLQPLKDPSLRWNIQMGVAGLLPSLCSHFPLRASQTRPNTSLANPMGWPHPRPPPDTTIPMLGGPPYLPLSLHQHK